jgi:hypothetical protein
VAGNSEILEERKCILLLVAMAYGSTPKKVKVRSTATLNDQLAVAEYNAYDAAISPDSIGKGLRLYIACIFWNTVLSNLIMPSPVLGVKMAKGDWYYCPDSENVFEFKETKGGYKDGTVIFDLDLDPKSTAEEHTHLLGERASPGDQFHNRKTKQEDMHPVSQEKFMKQLVTELGCILSDKGVSPLKKTFKETFPNLTGAIRASDMTCESMRKKANKEFTPTKKASREDLIQAVLVTAAKRHTYNADRLGLDAVNLLLNSVANDNVAANQKGCEAEWEEMIRLFGEAESPQGVAELKVESGVKQRKVDLVQRQLDKEFEKVEHKPKQIFKSRPAPNTTTKKPEPAADNTAMIAGAVVLFLLVAYFSM